MQYVVDAPIRWARNRVDNIFTLSFFLAVFVHCSGGSLTLTVTGMSLCFAIISAIVCYRLYRCYFDSHDELRRARNQIRVLRTEINTLERFHRRMMRFENAINLIRNSLICPITLVVPIDAVVTRSGHVFSNAALMRWARNEVVFPCPVTRNMLQPIDVMLNYPVRNVCTALRMLDGVCDVV
jgi:hypothetical protein